MTDRRIGGLARRRVLLAEDHPVNQDVTLGMLELLGCQVVIRANGRTALDAFMHEQFDLVLMDCQMPEMDGYEATRTIRSWEARAGAAGRPPLAVPIVAVTASAMPGDRQRCLDAGMNDYLVKPFTLASLRDVLSRYLPDGLPVQQAAGTDEGSAVGLDLRQMQALLRSGGAAAIERMLVLLEQSTNEKLAELGDAVHARNAAGCASLAHFMKGAVSMLGLARVTALLQDFAQAARAGRMDECTDSLPRLRETFRRDMLALRAAFSGMLK